MRVTRTRSLVKSLSYRVFGTLSSFAVVYIITRQVVLSAAIAFWETALKLVIYYWHERIWDKIHWGRIT